MNSGTRVAQAALLAGAAALAWGGTSRATVIPADAYYGDTFTTTAGFGGAPNMDSRNTSPEINNTGTAVSWTSDIGLQYAYPHTYYGYVSNDPADGVNPAGASTGALAMADFGTISGSTQGTLVVPIPTGITKFMVSADFYPFQTDIGFEKNSVERLDQYLGLVLTQTSNGNSDTYNGADPSNNTRIVFYNYPQTDGNGPDDTQIYTTIRQTGDTSNHGGGIQINTGLLPNDAVYHTDQFNTLPPWWI